MTGACGKGGGRGGVALIIMYKLDPTMMREWKDSESIGEYYNLKIRGNSQIEDDEIACGCNPNPCEQGQVDRFNTRFASIS
jgi:hypothetical protein